MVIRKAPLGGRERLEGLGASALWVVYHDGSLEPEGWSWGYGR